MNEFLQKVVHEFQTPFRSSVLVFAVILFIILLAPIVLKRLRLPGIIGLIISGIIIGPNGLHLIEKNSAVDLFSTIGLLYIMFIAGLELDLGEFRKNKYKSLVFGVLTFLIPIAIGFPVCLYLLDYGFNTSVLTASMFATHTLIAYPIVSRLGISKNEAVAITVGGTILTDTVVLIILAVIVGAEEGGLTPGLWARLSVSISIFLLIVFFLIPRIAAWFFKRLADEKNAHFIFVLSVVFFCAFIADLSGLEPIIGAFAAGLTLNRLIPHTSTLMNRVEFVGNSLFIPFFLISVGMVIDVRVLAKGPDALFVTAVLTIVALLSKWGAAFTTATIFNYTPAQRNLIFGLSSSHAAATLAIILVGFNIGIIDDNILNGTVVLILITCVVASFVTEHAGKKVVLQEEKDEIEQIVRKSQRTLVPISNPATMERLIDLAITLLEPKHASPIVALTVVDDDASAQPKLLQARKMLEKAIAHAASADQKIEITTTIDQNTASGVKRVVREMFITDIIMGWPSKTNLADIIFGKAFDNVINQTTQNVFIARLELPINVHKKLHVLCPPLAEKEEGFTLWMSKVFQMAAQLSLNVVIHAPPDTLKEIEKFSAQSKIASKLSLIECPDISNLDQFKTKFHANDLITLVSSRKASISHTPYLEALPRKMVRQFNGHSLIFIYPEIQTPETLISYTREAESGLLESGLEILRGAKDIFKKS